MDSDLKNLYQDLLLEHHHYPRNYGRLESPTHEAEGYNPLCGDHIHLTLRVVGDRIEDIRFEGQSCVICKASASIMTTLVKQASLQVADQAFEAFHELLTQPESPHAESLPAAAREKLALFATVRNFPMRVKCATLPWHTLRAALHQPEQKIVSTE